MDRRSSAQAEVVKKQQSSSQNLKRSSFNLTKLRSSWKRYADFYKSDRNHKKIVSMMLDECNITLQGEQITLNLSNPMQQNLLNEVKPGLLKRIRTDMENDYIEINGVIQQYQDQEGNTTQRPYTTIEKFKYLSDKFPSLKTLQEKLGLEVDG